MANTFNKNKHEYLINGKRATGVTTIINVLDKPALIPWAARMVVEYIKRVGLKTEGVDEWRVTTEQLTEAQDAHRKKKEAGGTHGTNAHSLVEEYINLCLKQNDTGLPLMPASDEMEVKFEPIEPFIDWALENVKEFLFSERQMYDEALFIAGTADFGCILKTGQRLIGDFKTSGGVYGIDYFLQCAGYKLLAEANGDKDYDGCVIVRVGKKGPKDFDVHYSYDTVTAEMAFMACLTIYRAKATLTPTN